MIAIGSVRHTGTRFCRELFHCPNYHFGEKQIERLDPYTVITPLRRLESIMASWARRDLDLADLHEALTIMVDYGSDYYLPIDSDNRDMYLWSINEGEGTNYQTDWEILVDPKISAPGWSIDPEWEKTINDDFYGFFSGFYNE
jgi:hypothetical protein